MSETPSILMPNDRFDDGIVVASCWQSDDPAHESGVWATILLLLPEPRYYVVEDVAPDMADVTGEWLGTWHVVSDSDSNFDNIIPAAEFFADQIGGY